jgi:hypothetical protein
MASKWAVLVIHGVGDSKPGTTVDAFVPALASARPRHVCPEGGVEVRWLRPDDFTRHAGPPQTSAPQAVDFFPVHIRRARITAGGESPTEAVFAEVYWADLSRIREGLVQSVLALISTIFLIRFISDQAAVMPAEPDTKDARSARKAARWLRACFYLTAFLLNGPIAALCILLTCVLVVNHVVLPAFQAKQISVGLHGVIMMAVGLIGAIAGGLTWRYGRRLNWASTWTRIWGAFAVAGVLFGVIVAIHGRLSQANQERAVNVIAEWVGYTSGAVSNDPDEARADKAIKPDRARTEASIKVQLLSPLVLLAEIQVVFVLISLLVTVALIFWGYAVWQAPEAWRPALNAAYGTALLQITLWMLVIPPLALLTIAAVVQDQAQQRELRRLLSRIEGGFALFLVFAMLISAFALVVWLRRLVWVRDYQADYQFPYHGRDIPRLIVNILIIAAVLVLTSGACGLSVLSAFSSVRPDPIPARWATVIAVPLFAFILSYFHTGVRNWLHVITDIINHFYRRRDRFPRPWGPEIPCETSEFEIQQKIEARFRAVLKEVLDDSEVTKLSVVSHSQGTIITVDVFSLSGMETPYRQWLTHRLVAVGRLSLITMGSPLTHLYQYYFPSHYGSLASSDWDSLRWCVKDWVNIYRIDDYVGTYIEPPLDGWDGNVPIHAGGHTDYWGQPAVFQAVRQKARDSLPG